jgi:hypothetical protein
MEDTSELNTSEFSTSTSKLSDISTDLPIEPANSAEAVDSEQASGKEQDALYDLFNTVIEYGKQVRSRGLDGLDMWNKIKKLFSADTGNCEWNIKRTINGESISDLSAIYDYVHDELGMKGGDEDQDVVDKAEWEKYHFFLQLIRIAKKNPDCSLMRLMQVAYNVGQLQADYEDPAYTAKVKEFYDSHQMQSLRAYVNPAWCTFGSADLQKLVAKVKSNMPSDMTGGSDIYYRKYLKYKAKYEALKLQKH